LSRARLVVPCDHTEAGTKVNRSHVIFSDDGGRTWHRSAALGEKTNECQVVERGDGTLLLNMRSYHGKNRRAVATSKDGGRSWSPVTLDKALIEPVCQASLVRDPARGRLLFSNPASTRREKLTVRLSSDDGRTWPVARCLHEGPAAYSCLAVLPDGAVGCLYERGTRSAYEKITFARFGLDWLSGGRASSGGSRPRLATHAQRGMPEPHLRGRQQAGGGRRGQGAAVGAEGDRDHPRQR
jgi:sialidase-1